MPTHHEIEANRDHVPDRTAQALLNLRCAVDHCHDAVFIADPTGKLGFVNAAFEELTGYSAGEAAEGGLALILESDPGSNSPAEIVATLVEEALEKGVYRGSVSGVRRDGRR